MVHRACVKTARALSIALALQLERIERFGFDVGSSCRNETVQPERLRVQLPPAPLRRLQTGTGTAQTTAISTAAITAVIFSLVDRSMASSGSDANSAAALIRGLGITL
jgi:hypothetical protein